MTAVLNEQAEGGLDGQWGPRNSLDEVEQAVAALADGRSIVLLDDEGDGRGYLVHCAANSSADAVAFLVRYSSGYVRVAVTEDDAVRMNLPLQVYGVTDGEAYTVSVDSSHLNGTGISATDRASTIRLLGSPDTVPADFTRPGHVLPVRVTPGDHAQPGGCALALAVRACATPAAAYAEIVADGDGVDLARGVEVSIFASRHGLPVVRTSRI